MREISNPNMNCNAIARYYQPLEYLCFGYGLERRRVAFLHEVRNYERAIVCGGGDGRFLARLLLVNPLVEVDFVDLSAMMTWLAASRIASMGAHNRERVTFHTADLRDFKPVGRGYDLIVTNFLLDCFSDLEIRDVIGRLAGWAASNSQWLVSEFCEDEGRFSGIWTKSIVSLLYHAFRISTGLRTSRLPHYEQVLAEVGFQKRLSEHSWGGLLQSSLWVRPGY